jgi:hypothetical protein
MKNNFHIYIIGGIVADFAYFLLFVGIGFRTSFFYDLAVIYISCVQMLSDMKWDFGGSFLTTLYLDGHF